MSIELSEGLQGYIDEKVKGNGSGGRPHFLADQAKEKEPTDVLLDIAELAFLRDKTPSQIAKKLHTSYHTIYRLLQDLDPFKPELLTILETVPRRKTFWNRTLNTSDYDSVQAFIKYAEREELKAYKARLNMAENLWKALGYKDPKNWHIDEVLGWIKSQPDGSQSGYVDAVRAIAPHFTKKTSPDYMPVGKWRAKIKKRKKPLFGQDIILVHQAIDAQLTPYHKDVFDLHITGGFREGASHPEAGLTGISWDRFTHGFTRVDDYESKVRSRGMYWRNCPVDLFFHDLPDRLRKRWEAEGKPTSAKVVKGGYPELLQIYKEIRMACKAYWQGKVEPSLLKEMSTLRPHDADKIHCNLCWEAGISLEVVAGQDLGNQEGLGLVGRGWLSTDTIKKYYLSLTQRSPKYKEMLAKVAEYASQFNGAD